MAKFIGPTIVAGSLLALTAAQAFDLQGHRGARGLAPENTLAGFATALSIGVTTLELDLAMTKDGVAGRAATTAASIPTTRAARTASFSTREGPAIRSLTLAELQRYDVGRLKPGTPMRRPFRSSVRSTAPRIPTLAEVFDLVRRAEAPTMCASTSRPS